MHLCMIVRGTGHLIVKKALPVQPSSAAPETVVVVVVS